MLLTEIYKIKNGFFLGDHKVITVTTKTDSLEQTKVLSRQEFINFHVEKYTKTLMAFDKEILEPIKRDLRKELNRSSQ